MLHLTNRLDAPSSLDSEAKNLPYYYYGDHKSDAMHSTVVCCCTQKTRALDLYDVTN